MMKKKGYTNLQENIRRIKTPDIDTIINKYRDKDYTVKIETQEFTCLCPKTGLPDFATIYIEYNPDKLCIELKSFKEYLFFFRNFGIFHEHVTNRILEDLVRSCRPKWARIRTEFNIRGGIKTTVSAEYPPH